MYIFPMYWITDFDGGLYSWQPSGQDIRNISFYSVYT